MHLAKFIVLEKLFVIFVCLSFFSYQITKKVALWKLLVET